MIRIPPPEGFGRAAFLRQRLVPPALFLLLVSFVRPAASPRLEVRYDVFTLMAEVRRQEAAPLWPGFDPAAIPVALYDEEDTYLFDAPRPLENFRPLADGNGAYVFKGRHPAVFGNRRTKLDGVWVATCLMSSVSPLTGESHSLSEMAGIVLHEKFHVFQALSHPDWRPNDAVLLQYPLDTASSLTLRMMEIEALRRAVAAGGLDAPAGWARASMNIRRQRLGVLTSRQAAYEKELARFEGIAEYIEYLACGRPPFDGVPDPGFAPKAVREAGYFEGRWEAGVLDRLDPGWKNGLEAGEFRYLEDRLEAILRAGPPPRAFTSAEMREFRERAAAAILWKESERRERLKDFESGLGTRIELIAGDIPLRLEMLDPSSMEALGEGKMLHERWLILKSDEGVVEVLGRPCLTELNDEGRIARLVCPGYAKRNPIRLGNGPVSFQLDGMIAYFKGGRVIKQGDFRILIFLR